MKRLLSWIIFQPLYSKLDSIEGIEIKNRKQIKYYNRKPGEGEGAGSDGISTSFEM